MIRKKLLPLVFILMGVFAAPLPASQDSALILGSPLPGSELALDSGWEFFWYKTRDDLVKADAASLPLKGTPFTMPRYWNDLGFPAEGFGTYRLRFRTPHSAQPLALQIEAILTAFTVHVNGVKVHSEGTFGTSTESSVPGKGSALLFFNTPAPEPGESLSLVVLDIEVSNFDYRKSGMLDPPVLMDAKTALEHRSAVHSKELILVGGLLMMGLYHLGLWLFRPADRSALWFGLFCLGVMLRFMVTGAYVMTSVFPDFSWEWGKKFEFMIFNLTSIPFMYFLSSLFPKARYVPVEKVLTGISLLLGLFILVMPTAISNLVVVPMQGFILLAFAYYMTVLFRANRAKLPGSGLFFLGLLVLLFGAVNDMLVANQIIHGGYLLPVTFFAVIVLQGFILSRNFAASFVKAEQLTGELSGTNQSLRRFIPQEFFGILGRSEVRDIVLGDMVQKEMTIMFTDIRGFTAMSEKMSPTQTFAFLNSFFGRMGQVVRKHDGFIDKYLGDGFLALYPASPDSALKAAIEIQSEIVAYNHFRAKSGYVPIELGIGIHHGLLTLGTVGEAGRMDTTVIADSVNLASRMEALTKLYGKGTMVTMSFLDLLDQPEALHWRYLGKVRVQGRTEAIEAVHVFDGLPENEFRMLEESKSDFEEALALYRGGDLSSARDAFARLVQKEPVDRASQTYLNRITFLLDQGLPEDWDAVEATGK